jgi:hypothetical protein
MSRRWLLCLSGIISRWLTRNAAFLFNLQHLRHVTGNVLVIYPDSANACMSTYCTAISLIKRYCGFERARIPNSPREIKRFAISNEQTTFLRRAVEASSGLALNENSYFLAEKLAEGHVSLLLPSPRLRLLSKRRSADNLPVIESVSPTPPPPSTFTARADNMPNAYSISRIHSAERFRT